MVIRYYVLLLLCYHYLVNKDLHKSYTEVHIENDHMVSKQVSKWALNETGHRPRCDILYINTHY